MNLLRLVQILIVVIPLSCQSTAVKTEIPAHIINPSAESRAELQQILAEAFDRQSITLADDALTKSSLLIIDRKQHRSVQNIPLMGRDLGMPDQFQLILNNNQCILVQKSNNRRWSLPNTQCVAE